MYNAGPIPNQDFLELKRIAHVEFQLTPIRQPVGDGFLDTLILDFSRDVNDHPGRKEVVKGLLALAQYKEFTSDVFYLPIDRNDDPENAFVKSESGKLYVADRKDIAVAVDQLFHKIDGIVNHPHSLCVNVCVDGLDYFDHVSVHKRGPVYVVDSQLSVPRPAFYTTNYPETAESRVWIQSQFKEPSDRFADHCRR